MNSVPLAMRQWWWRRFHPAVRLGWIATRSGIRNQNSAWTTIGGILIAAGIVLGRLNRRELVYATRVDQGENVTIRVRRGRRLVASASVES